MSGFPRFGDDTGEMEDRELLRKYAIHGSDGWMLFTLVAMSLQCGILIVIIRAILVAATSYAQ